MRGNKKTAIHRYIKDMELHLLEEEVLDEIRPFWTRIIFIKLYGDRRIAFVRMHGEQAMGWGRISKSCFFSNMSIKPDFYI